MNLLCKVFDHKLRPDANSNRGIWGPCHCIRKGCDYKDPAMKIPPMPKCNQPRETKIDLIVHNER